MRSKPSAAEIKHKAKIPKGIPGHAKGTILSAANKNRTEYAINKGQMNSRVKFTFLRFMTLPPSGMSLVILQLLTVLSI